MPHCTVEYTDNLRAEGDIPALLPKINRILIEQGSAFPIGGIRSRAIELKDYCMADGAADYAFVHVTLKIGAGRDEAVKKKACDALFEMIKQHFADLYSRRYLALSMELAEFNEAGTWKHNNVHARFKKP
jgi:5-carboxymethyl-2-hydroxymuconate isomerase